MYRIKDIKDSLKSVVGWRQSYDLANQIDTELTTSESGISYQDIHPLVTLENISSIMPLDYYKKYPEYSDTETYAVGDKVRFNSDPLLSKPSVWIAINVTTGEQPSEGSQNWKRYNALSDYLRELNEKAITATITKFITEKTIAGETKTLLERRPLFDGSGYYTNQIDPTKSMVGYEILPVRAMGVTTKIERIGLQFTKPVKVKMYLFHSSQPQPIHTFDLNYTGNGAYQWFDAPDVFLPYISEETSPGGTWYLCYDQESLPYDVFAINMAKDFSAEPCGTCNVGSVQAWRELTKYIQISPFRNDSKQGENLFNIQSSVYTPATCYGMNVQFTVACDITDFIISERLVFANALSLQMAAYILRELALNPNVRQNANQLNIDRESILYEVDGVSQGRAQGIGHQLNQAMKALSVDTKGMDRICLTCRNGGIRFKST